MQISKPFTQSTRITVLIRSKLTKNVSSKATDLQPNTVNITPFQQINAHQLIQQHYINLKNQKSHPEKRKTGNRTRERRTRRERCDLCRSPARSWLRWAQRRRPRRLRWRPGAKLGFAEPTRSTYFLMSKNEQKGKRKEKEASWWRRWSFTYL